jgi:putative addiction module component (TIGR02574 family)
MKFGAMTRFNDILDAAQRLSAADQHRLIEALWSHLPPNEWPVPDTAWIAESQRRSAAFEVGTMSASPWPDVQARARQRAGLSG